MQDQLISWCRKIVFINRLFNVNKPVNWRMTSPKAPQQWMRAKNAVLTPQSRDKMQSSGKRYVQFDFRIWRTGHSTSDLATDHSMNLSGTEFNALCSGVSRPILKNRLGTKSDPNLLISHQFSSNKEQNGPEMSTSSDAVVYIMRHWHLASK